MNDDLRHYLDGESERDALPRRLEHEAAAWEGLFARMREHVSSSQPSAALEERIMTDVASLPAGTDASVRTRLRRTLRWWTRPRSVSISPLAGLAAAAVLAFLLLLPSTDRGEPGSPLAGDDEAPVVTILVEFSLDAPNASSVAVLGDFSAWEPSLLLSDLDGDGVWTGRLALDPGVHRYMFLVDGQRWVTDPGAERFVDDGFGNRNAVVAVPAPSGV